MWNLIIGLVEALKHVRALQMLVVLTRQAVEVQRLADVCFDPIGELGIARRPAHEPRLQILLGLFESAPVVEPAQLLTTILGATLGAASSNLAAQRSTDCTASGFLDSGLTVFASTPQRPARGGRVAPGPGFGSRTSPANSSSARCTSA